ncbi:hypothetical protein ATANTOWER_030884, partial [Ataeniobius toweri]|nr:hypothetical protein [Ataeniobius toweri]
LEDAGSSNLGHLLSRYISASQQYQLGSTDMNPSPGLSTLSPGSSGLSNAHTPARPSSTSSTGSRGSSSASQIPDETSTSRAVQVYPAAWKQSVNAMHSSKRSLVMLHTLIFQ